MKKLIAACLLSAGVMGTMSLSGCVAENPIITEEDLTVKSHFYPIVSGSKYTYARYNGKNGYDTVTYQVRVGQTRADMNYLDRVDSNDRVPRVLYYFAISQDQFGNPAAVLKDTSQFYALAGNLEKGGNPWIAQESPRMWGEVVQVYDEFIVSDKLHFYDVIGVKYWQDNSKDYIVRFYAKNYGLIKEKRYVGGQTEIGSLQLVARTDSYGNWIRSEELPPVDRRFGKLWKMTMEEQLDKR